MHFVKVVVVSPKKICDRAFTLYSIDNCIIMDSEEETLYDDNENDSGNESSGDDVDFAMEVESAATRDRQNDTDDYPYEVLSTEEIVQHMVDCIKDVNTVVEVRSPILFCVYLFYIQTYKHTQTQ